MSKFERTEWRDKDLSLRHRTWGLNVPATDIDFLLIEYDKAKPIALIEYKNEHIKEVNLDDPNIKAVAKLGNMAKLPAFYVVYSDNFNTFWVHSLNKKAKELVDNVEVMNESRFVSMLYVLRGRTVPREILDALKKPEKEKEEVFF